MAKKNGTKKMVNQERHTKNIEHLPNPPVLELNSADPDIITTISNDSK